MFVRLSGDVSAVKAQLETLRPHLNQKKINEKGEQVLEKQFFSEWSHAEDTALFKGADSHDYEILLKTKGASELERRRKFLNV